MTQSPGPNICPPYISLLYSDFLTLSASLAGLGFRIGLGMICVVGVAGVVLVSVVSSRSLKVLCKCSHPFHTQRCTYTAKPLLRLKTSSQMDIKKRQLLLVSVVCVPDPGRCSVSSLVSVLCSKLQGQHTMKVSSKHNTTPARWQRNIRWEGTPWRE